MTGRMYDERLGKIHFWMTFIFFNADVRPDAHHRPAGDAPARRRLRRAVRRLEPVHLVSRRSSSALSRRSCSSTTWSRAGAAARARPRTRGARSRSSGRCPRRRRSSTSTASRPSSAARTSTACPAPSTASSSRPPRRPRDRRRPPRRRSGAMSKVLVVANETLGGEALIDAVRARAEKGDATSCVVVPADQPRHGDIIYSRRCATPPRCASTWRRRSWRAQGIEIEGEVGDADPFHAAMDAVARVRARRDHRLHPPGDAVGVAAQGPRRAHARRDRAPRRARRHRPPRRGPAVQRSRWWSPTRPSAATSCSSSSRPRRPRAGGRQARVHRRRPAEGRRSAHDTREARRRLDAVLDGLRGRGPARRRDDRRPRSLHGDDERAQHVPRRRRRHLHASRRRVGLAARRPDRAHRRARRRVPVEHVVVDLEAATARPGADGSRRHSRRPRRPPRAARGQPQLAGRAPAARDAAFHHLARS